MNELELRIRVQNTLQDTIDNMVQQGVPFTMVEDALYKALSYTKDRAYQELLYSLTTSVPTENENSEEKEDSEEKEE